jgi:hypothetical protein
MSKTFKDRPEKFKDSYKPKKFKMKDKRFIPSKGRVNNKIDYLEEILNEQIS